MTNITQEDRDAAEKLVLNTPRFLTGITRDHRALTEAFARHREAAEAKERERIVAWLRANPRGMLAYEDEYADAISRGEHMEANNATSE